MRCGRAERSPSVQPPDCGSSKLLKRWSRGPMNIKMLRVRAAAARSIVLSEIFSGGVMTTLAPCHSTETLSERSTSMRRLTSSIFGMCSSVVVPRLRSEAARSATAPFFERLVSTFPESFLPPSMMKFISPCMRSILPFRSVFALGTRTRYHAGNVLLLPKARHRPRDD